MKGNRQAQGLAKPRRDLGWRIFPRRLSFTREGKVYVGITLGVGFAAVNTGNNLLFLVLGLMLGLIIVSGILSEITLRGISISRKLPKRIEAGAPFAVEIALTNNKRIATSFGVEIRDEINSALFRRRCFFLRVGPQEQRAVAYRCELPKRGRNFFNGAVVSTRFPFGFFEKRRFFEIADQIIVLPARLPISIPFPHAREGDGIRSVSRLGGGQEFRELKEMEPGDDPRRIHWRTTARLGRPVIKETDADAQGFIEIVLDPAPPGTDEAAFAQAERNIEAAGTVVRDMTTRGLTVRLVTSARNSLEARNGNEAIPLLEHLALIDTAAAAKDDPPMGSGSESILIGPRSKANGASNRLKVPRTPLKRVAGAS